MILSEPQKVSFFFLIFLNMTGKTKTKPRRRGRLYYHSQIYKNPFFPKHQSRIKKSKLTHLKPIKISWRLKLAIVIFLLILALIIYFLFYSSYFNIKTIKAEGEGRVSPETIEKLAWRQIKNNFFILWPEKNIFLFRSEKLIQTLNSKYVFSFIKITKKFPRTILVKYKEKEYDLIWQEAKKYFYANSEGNIITEITPEEAAGKSYPLIENQSEALISNRKITAGETYLRYALILAKKLPKYTNLPPVEKYIIDQELNTVKVKFKNGPLVYFNIKNSVDKQIRKLIILKQEKLDLTFFDLSYIDLRYGDSVYYR